LALINAMRNLRNRHHETREKAKAASAVSSCTD
jgi:hypothetical protein